MILSSGAKSNQINFSKNHVSGNARKIGVTFIWWFTISQVRALDLFYTSEVYRSLSNLEYHLHNRSDAYIVDELMLELQTKM